MAKPEIGCEVARTQRQSWLTRLCHVSRLSKAMVSFSTRDGNEFVTDFFTSTTAHNMFDEMTFPHSNSCYAYFHCAHVSTQAKRCVRASCVDKECLQSYTADLISGILHHFLITDTATACSAEYCGCCRWMVACDGLLRVIVERKWMMMHRTGVEEDKTPSRPSH